MIAQRLLFTDIYIFRQGCWEHSREIERKQSQEQGKFPVKHESRTGTQSSSSLENRPSCSAHFEHPKEANM